MAQRPDSVGFSVFRKGMIMWNKLFRSKLISFAYDGINVTVDRDRFDYLVKCRVGNGDSVEEALHSTARMFSNLAQGELRRKDENAMISTSIDEFTVKYSRDKTLREVRV